MNALILNPDMIQGTHPPYKLDKCAAAYLSHIGVVEFSVVRIMQPNPRTGEPCRNHLYYFKRVGQERVGPFPSMSQAIESFFTTKKTPENELLRPQK